jgi:hypothetical protein
MLRNDAVRLCQENNFNTGFFEGSDNNSVVDAYELKVILYLIFLYADVKLFITFVDMRTISPSLFFLSLM